ncbi:MULTISPECIES: MFS transporter [Leuconostoc]|uniref:Xyloside transporter XynT n=1 Tax=Leuconostoc inhae TaxID=178001 RepID=A0AAN2QU66_9LACO|nr:MULTISPECIES: MFS transporter [Leuconostoc]AFS39608.1 xyloside transporter [Leuconostoc gelidum JB7]MBZ5944134.1 MFS transporter [Leuconostoc gasicomitatum]MBZ5946156.1 MFS transporter [Leuconostoc gasicomitatum]MBZ5947789.1 MFS transporter [Leuconostoc gasicomitatum]MBZ5949570.1 MFS transporter [Leuconostoc gasicomitatum]
MDVRVQKNDEFAKLSTWDRVSYGLGDFAQNLVFGTVGGFLLFYLTNINGISAGVGATIFLVVRWINVIWDPWVGTVVDKAKITKNGKYRPFLINFGIPLVILAALLFLPVAKVLGAGTLATTIYATVSYMATALVYSFVNIPYGSLNASLTRDETEIGKLTSTRMMLANIGNLLVYTLFPLFVQLASPNAKLTDTGLFGLKLKLGNYAAPSAAGAWFKVYGVYMILGAVLLFLTYRNTKERVLASEEATDQVKYTDLFAELKRNKALQILGLFFLVGFTLMFFGNTVWPYFMQYNFGVEGGKSALMASIGLIGSIPGIFLVVIWPRLRATLGKKGFFYTFLGIFVVGQLLLLAWSKNPSADWLGFTGRFLQQWGLTSATGFMWALVPEVVSNGEYISGKRVAGIINAIMGLFFKIGLALGGIIPGYLLQFMNFKSGALTQSASAQTGIEWSMIWLPMIMAFLAMFVISRYPLSDAYVDKMNHTLKEKNS